MTKHTSAEFRNALLRVYHVFLELPAVTASLPELKHRLYEVAKGYREHKAFSGDTWMSHSQLTRALRSMQSDLRRVKRGMNHPLILRHLDVNHPRHYMDRSTAQDISEALSAVGWALANLEEDYSSGGYDESGRQRRTRTATRDQYLIPQLTWMILDFSGMDILENYQQMQEAENMIRKVLQEWPIITGNPAAKSYHRIARKPLRRLIRAAASSRVAAGEK